MSKQQPSNLELQVLSVLWDHGPLSARQVLERMPDGKDRAYTTILSTLQGLEKKKLVRHTSQGNTHIYHPKVEKSKVLRPMLRNMVDYIFGGRKSEAMLYLLRETEVSEDELSEIRNVIAEYEQQSHPEQNKGSNR